MSKASYTVTAALPYANGPLHLGHVAGVYLPADIFVRFLRMNGHDAHLFVVQMNTVQPLPYAPKKRV